MLPKKTQNLRVGIGEQNILFALATYHYLSAQQLCRLLYSPSSLTFVQTKLKELSDGKYCQRLFLPRPSRYGSAPSVYRLASKGLSYLSASGKQVGRYRPVEERAHSYLFLAHTLAVNSVLIAAALLCRTSPEFVIRRMAHERDLKREPMTVLEGDGRKLAVIPDGYLDFAVNGTHQVCISLEIDRGTYEQKVWRQKVRALLAAASGPYQQRFETASLTFAVVATPGEKRLWELMRWTEAELKEASQDQRDLFRFTGANPETASPRALFLHPVWFRPFDKTGRPLLEGVRSQAA